MTLSRFRKQVHHRHVAYHLEGQNEIASNIWPPTGPFLQSTAIPLHTPQMISRCPSTCSGILELFDLIQLHATDRSLSKHAELSKYNSSTIEKESPFGKTATTTTTCYHNGKEDPKQTEATKHKLDCTPPARLEECHKRHSDHRRVFEPEWLESGTVRPHHIHK